MIIAFLVVFFISAIFVVGFISFKINQKLKERNRILTTYRRIFQIILEDLDFKTVVQKLADTIPNELQFGTGVLSILDQNRGVLKRVAASRTKQAIEAIKALSVPFEKIEIPITDQNNVMVKAILQRKSFVTNDVYDVLGPILTREESAKIQIIMGTKTTLVYPIFLKSKPLGVFIASTSKEQHQISSYELEIIDSFANLAGLFLQNSILFSSLKDTSQALEKANERLKELDRLKDDFVSVASHELRTPMTAIRSYVWMALHRADIKLSEKMRRYLYRTLISTERLINLVNDLLNVSRIEGKRIEVNPRPFDMIELVKDVVEEVSARANEMRIKVLVLDHPNTPKVFADVDKVHEVLLNLIGNSLKFTYPEGIVSIDCFTDGNMLEVSVKDSGAGISKDDLARLFQKFGRLDNSYVSMSTSGGTGLGLYISRSLIDLMHGKIWATSEGIGKGSTFTFSLPIATENIVSQSEKFHIKPLSGEAKELEPVAI